MSSSNCCFLNCIQVSQEASQVVWYSQLFQNFPQFIVIHTLKGFGMSIKVWQNLSSEDKNLAEPQEMRRKYFGQDKQNKMVPLRTSQ